ncbi:hypothetical protein Droror1_Dr00012006 [Drosera rotundifolia]
MATPQQLVTFLAPGELTYGFNLGSFVYPQRHGLCSLSLAHQSMLGEKDWRIAVAHALSCIGSHFPSALVTAACCRRTTTAAATTKLAHHSLVHFGSEIDESVW